MSVNAVEIPHEPLQASVNRIIQKIPFDGTVMAPFRSLADLASHEDELLAGVAPHETEKGAQIGQFLPLVPGILESIDAFP